MYMNLCFSFELTSHILNSKVGRFVVISTRRGNRQSRHQNFRFRRVKTRAENPARGVVLGRSWELGTKIALMCLLVDEGDIGPICFCSSLCHVKAKAS